MMLVTPTWRLTILVVLLAIASGCSGGNDTVPERTAQASTKPRHWTADIHDLYRAGQPDKARDVAMHHVDQALAACDKRPRLESKIGALGIAPFVAGIVLECEEKYVTSGTKPLDESSKKVAGAFVEKMERAAKLAADLTASVTLEEREQLALRQLEEKRATVLKQWILMHPCDQREGIYQKHVTFLEAQGIRSADLVDADKPRAPTEDDLLLESAKAENEAVREAINAYYQALFAGNAKALRNALSKETTEKRIEQVLAKLEQEMGRNGVKSVASVDLDKATIEPERAAGKQVFVRAKGIKFTLERKEGGTFVVEKNEAFRITKEEEKWVLCLP